MNTPGIFPSGGYGGAFAPRGDVSVLFGQLRGVGAADFEFEHWFAEFDFAEEKEAGVAGGLGLAIVGGLGGNVRLGRGALVLAGIATGFC